MTQPAQSIADTLSETSVGIAGYVMVHGRRISNITYLLERRLRDGRELQIYFTDVDKTGNPENMPNAELRVNVTPVAVGQFGFESVEKGLNGRWIEYVLRLGPPTGDGVTIPKYKNHDFISMPSNVSDLVTQHFQHRYTLDVKDLLGVLLKPPLRVD